MSKREKQSMFSGFPGISGIARLNVMEQIRTVTGLIGADISYLSTKAFMKSCSVYTPQAEWRLDQDLDPGAEIDHSCAGQELRLCQERLRQTGSEQYQRDPEQTLSACALFWLHCTCFWIHLPKIWNDTTARPSTGLSLNHWSKT